MYKTVSGDTFDTISRKVYGVESQSSIIAKANPGVSEPISAGTEIILPTSSLTPVDKLQTTNNNSKTEVALLIDGERFRFWSELQLTRSIDSMDVVKFSAPYDSKNKLFRNLFRPFSFKSVVITVGGEPLFTGVMLSPASLINDSKVISVNCYALPAVLNDSVMPASSYPIAYDNLTIKEWATILGEPFGIDNKFDSPIGVPFERIAIYSKQSVLSFLITLAKQRNLIISNTPRGKLLFHQSVDPGSPVAILRQGEPPLQSVKPVYNPQQYYSHITGIRPTELGRRGIQFTVKNPLLSGVLRVMTFQVPDVSDADVQTAVLAKMGRMFGNMVSYNISVPTWFDAKGNLWKPNTTIILHAHDAMIWTDYEFIIRNVDFRNTKNSLSVTMNLVLPGSFSGKIPKRLPWDE